MATTSTAPASAEPAASKPRFDPLRPVRYAVGFATGTVQTSLNGMANWGRKGMWLGTGGATLVTLAGATVAGMTGGLGLIVLGAVAGLVGGAVAGGAVGAVTGGIRGIDREVRKDKYSEDLLARARARGRKAPRSDYREAHREHKRGEAYNLDRIFQQEREIEGDTSTYFRDMVDNSRSGGHERGR